MLSHTWGYLLAYALYMAIYLLVSGFCFKFDNVRGLTKLLAKAKMSFVLIYTVLIIVALLAIAIPTLIAGLWGVAVAR